ncbi:hypothetical protein [Kistimonas scapharcae]|uniref:hypothetical protein n=1 Tax=Kistimonas scapharcae TaxID=1036133 RepID=UPI0031E59825
MSSFKSIRSSLHISSFIYLITMMIYPSISIAGFEDDIYSETIEHETNDNATITIDELRLLSPGWLRQSNTEIRYGNPDTPYHKLSLIRGGSIGNTQIIKAPVGTRIVVSYSRYTALRCLYFDITDLGKSTIRFDQNFFSDIIFRVSNTKTLKPMFKSDFDHIISDNYYHCPWPEPAQY